MAVDRTVSSTTKVPGEITRLQVAVLVDQAAVTEEQIAAIEEMVAKQYVTERSAKKFGYVLPPLPRTQNPKNPKTPSSLGKINL
jgi:hypothetical protein